MPILGTLDLTEIERELTGARENSRDNANNTPGAAGRLLGESLGFRGLGGLGGLGVEGLGLRGLGCRV